MLTYMLDTNICVYLLKADSPDLIDRFNQRANELCVSAITLGELHYGAENSARRAENLEGLSGLVDRLDVLPFDANAAAHYGQLRSELRKIGRLAGPLDMLIGAHARSEGLILVTNNEREFVQMPGLRVENWVANP
ncbi:MAG TPA: type II toxin-antitoxin system VapC family toxin [Stellaceae bacterium]|nr:type II toxin-antitoxin system VapC family toxin [Stellaceae bacterium]